MQCTCTILLSAACPALLYFSKLPHKFNGFQKALLNVKCAYGLSLKVLSETFLILRRTERDRIINVLWSSREVPLAVSDFNETRKLLTDFQKIFKYQISLNSVQWEPSCCVQTDKRRSDNRQTDKDTQHTHPHTHTPTHTYTHHTHTHTHT